jgi:hypothetical protein
LSSNFWLTTAFVKKEFHPSSVHTFLIQFVKTVYINQKPALFPNILESHYDLGASIDGILMCRRGDLGFCFIRWVNSLYSPCGIAAPPSCPICGSVSPWSVKAVFPQQKAAETVPHVHKGMI